MQSVKLLVIVAIILPFLGNDISAQTCRVNCGVNSNGCRTYKEVYEYDYVTEKPAFPGGDSKFLEYINKTREYPAKAYKKGIQGRVICAFVVNADGCISNIQVLKGVESTLNAEALRILGKMPNWTPGRIGNQNVPVRVVYTIPFRK